MWKEIQKTGIEPVCIVCGEQVAYKAKKYCHSCRTRILELHRKLTKEAYHKAVEMVRKEKESEYETQKKV